MSTSALLKTSLHAVHCASNARMVPFAGWDMPVEYSGITAEHMAVRTRAGLFDVSHMGEIEIAGTDALAAVQRISSNDASRLAVGQAHYAGLLTPDGTFVDDMLVYRIAPRHFMLVVNAANATKDYGWISEQIRPAGEAACVDSSSRYALIGIQGPASLGVLQPLVNTPLEELKYYWFTHGEVANARALISRTGYTGEDGFEIFVPPNMAVRVWQALLESGRQADVIPCGLGARDTLRLEAAMRLYGSDIDESTTVLEADLGWMVGWAKDDFIGRDRLVEQKANGATRKLVGFEMVDRGIARHGHQVMRGDKPIGVVTSGTQTPFLKKAIGMAYVPTDLTAPGTEITIDVRGRATQARVVPLPFYKESEMTYPTDVKYTKDHEWIRVSGDTAEVGITEFAQQQLGDVVFVELPEVGRTVSAGEAFGSIESVKAVSELFAPMSGEVTAVNGALATGPEAVNADPHGTWIIKVRLSTPTEASGLLDASQYESLLG